MSQAGILNTGGITPPGPLETLTPTSNGAGGPGTPVSPIANNINIFSGSTSLYNVNGIVTSNGPVGELDVELTNTANFQFTTDDAPHGQTHTVTFNLVNSGAYNFSGTLTGFNTTSNLGTMYDLAIGARQVAGTATIIGSLAENAFQDAAMAGVVVTVSASGASFRVVVTGIAGQVIDWDLILSYRFVS